jgi:hypothetical protein
VASGGTKALETCTLFPCPIKLHFSFMAGVVVSDAGHGGFVIKNKARRFAEIGRSVSCRGPDVPIQGDAHALGMTV